MKTERRSADVLLSAAMALVFGLIFYTFNTPLGPSIGSDNAMYLTLGTALARGYAPYTQIFDHVSVPASEDIPLSALQSAPLF